LGIGKVVSKFDYTDFAPWYLYIRSNIFDKHYLNSGLSAGFFRNSIDLEKYFNDPDYVQDNVLIYGLQKSKIKFATDLSLLYRFDQIEGEILFLNVMFGSVKYNCPDIAYKPMKNFLLHI